MSKAMETKRTVFIFCLLTQLFSVSLGDVCDPDNCKLPNCHCPSHVPPAGMEPKDTPQMVLVTFDDQVNSGNMKYFRRLFPRELKNPNGCSIAGTFYNSHAGPTNYRMLKELWDRGHAVASHSISHKFPILWWDTATYRDYVDEIVGQKRQITRRARIPGNDIRGMRVPFLQIGGDNQFKMAFDYNFTYDSSMLTGGYTAEQFLKPFRAPFWPYTLDTPPESVMCDVTPGNCPKRSYPGLWEIPLNRLYGIDGEACGMADTCKISTEDDTFNYLMLNFFTDYYNRNRTPYGVYIHATWFYKPYTVAALERFIRYVAKMPDVWLITSDQLISWMKDPTPMSRIRDFQPWKNDRLCRQQQ